MSLADVASRLDRGATSLSAAAMVLAVACLAGVLALVLLQIAAGLLGGIVPALSRMLSASWEQAGFLMGAGFVLAMPATLRRAGHIRVSLLTDHLPKAGARVADIAASLILSGMAGFLGYAMTLRALKSLDAGSASTASLTPLWMPEAAFAIAFALFALQALARTFLGLAGQPVEAPRETVDTAPFRTPS